MTYRGPFSASSCQETAIAPRIHARACRRARRTSASYLGLRIRMTAPAASKSSNVSMTAEMNARCFFGESVPKCALSNTLISVSVTDGGGISVNNDGVRLSRSGIGLTLTDCTPSHSPHMRPANGQAVESVILPYGDFPQKEKAGSTGPSFCCLTVSGRASLQGAGNLIRLTKGLGAATPSRFGKPVGSPVHNPSAFEIHGYDLGHVVVSSVAALVERHPVSAT